LLMEETHIHARTHICTHARTLTHSLTHTHTHTHKHAHILLQFPTKCDPENTANLSLSGGHDHVTGLSHVTYQPYGHVIPQPHGMSPDEQILSYRVIITPVDLPFARYDPVTFIT